MSQRIAEILFDVSIQKRLDYYIPDHLAGIIEVGSWVQAPIRGSLRSGCVAAIKESSPFENIRPITNAISDGPVLTPDLFQLLIWMAQYYSCPITRVLKAMLPSGVRKGTERKMQYLVFRGKTRDELSLLYRSLAEKAPQQAAILEYMLQAKGGVLLTELLEKSGSTAAAAKALRTKGFLLFDSVKTGASSLLIGEEYFRTKPKALRPEQEIALEQIVESLQSGRFKTHLIWGVTGSGKTEVYMQAIDRALHLGKSALLLVPEIALTDQTIQRLKSRFQIPISVLHHRLSDGERGEAWKDIHEGKSRIVLGARSAIFSPIPNLGLIIVDEEHEASYKQSDDAPTYHARDLAVMRGSHLGATVVLGSATPSFESFHNAEVGKYNLITMSERSGSHPLPHVHIVDMRRENEKIKGIALLSDLLIQKIDGRIQRGEQSILFLNRRGYHTSSLCRNCSAVMKCPHCDTPFTFHRAVNLLACHLCGMEKQPQTTCPECHQEAMMQYRGAGTERLESTLKAILPMARVLRADFDTTRHKGSMERLLSDFRSGKADVLIGTQMVAKGLHFPEVTLVGVINCDSALHIPDFRASEQVFQLITQVSGRAGRGSEKGEVILQTSMPESGVIRLAAEQNFFDFYKEEIEVRKLFGYPPFQHIVKCSFTGPNENEVLERAGAFHKALLDRLPSNCSLHPPLPSGHAKIQDLWRYQILIRGPKVAPITSLFQEIEKQFEKKQSVRCNIDVDPLSTFF